MKHFISSQQLNTESIMQLIEKAIVFSSQDSFQYNMILKDRIVALAFFQPSTRTRLGSEVTVLRLGGRCIHLGENSSLQKGESFEDTIKTLAEFADCIVIRHAEEGTAEKAAQLVDIPIINGGDGKNELPMGGLLLFYQIYCYAIRKGKDVSQLSVLFYGPLTFSRACHSLILLLAKFKVKMLCACPAGLGLPEKYVKWIEAEGSALEYVDTDVNIAKIDVLLIPEVAAHKKELYCETQTGYGGVKQFYEEQITLELAVQFNSEGLIMSVPPLVWEIPKELEKDRRQVYTKIPSDGLHVKMAIFASLLAPTH